MPNLPKMPTIPGETLSPLRYALARWKGGRGEEGGRRPSYDVGFGIASRMQRRGIIRLLEPLNSGQLIV